MAKQDPGRIARRETEAYPVKSPVPPTEREQVVEFKA